jgi:multiple sugar transport system substrate-binding protein
MMNHATKCFMILLCLTLLAACSGKKDTPTDLTGTLKIVYADESYFHSEYGQFFHAKFPNVDFEVISTDEKNQFLAANGFDNGKFLEVYQPDLVRIDNLQQYAELAEAGVLADLEALIKADGYDIGSIDDNVMELLRKPVGGGLFALAPRFDNLALYYNIDLFNEHGVDPPRDGMTWDEVLELAGRFPADGDPKKRIAGFNDRTDLSSLVIQMAEAEGLGLYTGLNGELTFRSDRWRAIIGKVVEAGRSGTLYVPGITEITDFNPPGVSQPNLFITGRSAMTVDYLRLTDDIREMQNKLGKTFDYGVVTAPTGGGTGASGGGVLLYDIFGINASSPRQSLAWEFLKYAAGEEYAQLRSKSSPFLLSRSSFMKEKDGVSLEPFYKFRANPDARPLLGAHYLVYAAFDQALIRELPKAVAGERTLDETIEAIARAMEEAELQIPQ